MNESLAVIDRNMSDQVKHRIAQLGMPPLATTPGILTRRALRECLKKRHWVCEKTDGVRMLLYCDGGSVYVMDQKQHVYKVLAPERCDHFLRGPTILDGEMLLATRQYLAFDMLCCNGVGVWHRPLSQRLRELSMEVVAPFRQDLRDALPFEIIGKHFVPLQQVGKIFDCMTRSDAGHVYDDGKRRNRTDGVVVTPEEGTGALKWKFPDRQTVDFKVRQPFLTNPRLICRTDAGQDISVTHGYMSDEHRRVAERTGRVEVIVECTFDEEWKVTEVRKDKSEPNTLMTFVQIMHAMLEGLTSEDIVTEATR